LNFKKQSSVQEPFLHRNFDLAQRCGVCYTPPNPDLRVGILKASFSLAEGEYALFLFIAPSSCGFLSV